MNAEAKREIERLTRQYSPEVALACARVARIAMTWTYLDAAKVCRELSFTEMGPTFAARHQRNLCAAAIEARAGLDSKPRAGA